MAYKYPDVSLSEVLQCIIDCSEITKKEIFDVLQPPRMRKVSCINRITDILECITELSMQGYTEKELSAYMRKKNTYLDDKSPLKAIKNGMSEEVLRVLRETYESE